jgi:hypothetical protein
MIHDDSQLGDLGAELGLDTLQLGTKRLARVREFLFDGGGDVGDGVVDALILHAVSSMKFRTASRISFLWARNCSS